MTTTAAPPSSIMDDANEHHGTANLLAFAERCAIASPRLNEFCDYRLGATLLRKAAAIITRLAPLEPEIEAVLGED